MSDRLVQPAAFTLRPELGSTSFELDGIRFPAAWKPLVLALSQERYGREKQAVSMPVGSLNAALAALIPHLLTSPMWVRLQSDEKPVAEPLPWLLTESPADREPVWAVIQAWLEYHFGDLTTLAAARERMPPESLVSEPLGCPRSVPVHDNGTAMPPRPYFRLLPAWLAERLIEREAALRVLGAETRLLRVPAEEGVELMTWPPRQYEKKGREGAYSYTVRISVQTHAGCPLPRIHFHYGVRRWVSRPLWDEKALYIGREAKSVYMRVVNGWLGMPPTGGFTVARLAASKVNGVRLPTWCGGVPGMASRLGIQFPEAEEFTREPDRWICPGGRDGIEAAAVEKTPKGHPVQPGLGLDQHEEITMRLAEVLQDELLLCDPMISPPRLNTKKHLLKADVRRIDSKTRLDAVARSIGAEFPIEVLYRTPEFRDLQVERLLNYLHGDPPPPLRRGEKRSPLMPPPAPDEMEVALPGGQIQIFTRPVGAIGAPLPARKGNDGTWEHRRNATEDRIREIAREVKSVSGPALTLVELPDYRVQKELLGQRYRDPLLAIRLGFARTGRLTKFVDGSGAELEHRCEATAREGLRQLGYLPAPVGITFRGAGTLPEQLLVAAVWVVRLNRTSEHNPIVLPVVVLMSTADLQVHAWLPDGKPIRPYHQAQLDIVRMDAGQLRRSNQREQLNALQNFLVRDLPREGAEDILILADAQNCRQTWPGLTNTNLRFGSLVFDPRGPVQSIDRPRSRIRLIRLRTSETYETPEWFTRGAGPNSGYHTGLWRDPAIPGHYFAIGEKPQAMWGSRKGKQTDPGEFYAQPSILEILPVALHPDFDDPQLWSQAIYEWKEMSGVLTQGSTLRPLPLELARHMSRYARVISPYVDPTLWTETDDGEGRGGA